MCVNNMSKVALDSAADVIEPATSSRKSYALTTYMFVCNYIAFFRLNACVG